MSNDQRDRFNVLFYNLMTIIIIFFTYLIYYTPYEVFFDYPLINIIKFILMIIVLSLTVIIPLYIHSFLSLKYNDVREKLEIDGLGFLLISSAYLFFNILYFIIFLALSEIFRKVTEFIFIRLYYFISTIGTITYDLNFTIFIIILISYILLGYIIIRISMSLVYKFLKKRLLSRIDTVFDEYGLKQDNSFFNRKYTLIKKYFFISSTLFSLYAFIYPYILTLLVTKEQRTLMFLIIVVILGIYHLHTLGKLVKIYELNITELYYLELKRETIISPKNTQENNGGAKQRGRAAR